MPLSLPKSFFAHLCGILKATEAQTLSGSPSSVSWTADPAPHPKAWPHWGRHKDSAESCPASSSVEACLSIYIIPKSLLSHIQMHRHAVASNPAYAPVHWGCDVSTDSTTTLALRILDRPHHSFTWLKRHLFSLPVGNYDMQCGVQEVHHVKQAQYIYKHTHTHQISWMYTRLLKT